MIVLSSGRRRSLLAYLAVGVVVALWGHFRQDPADPAGLAFLPWSAPLTAHLVHFALWFVGPMLLWPLFLAGIIWAIIVV